MELFRACKTLPEGSLKVQSEAYPGRRRKGLHDRALNALKAESSERCLEFC